MNAPVSGLERAQDRSIAGYRCPPPRPHGWRPDRTGRRLVALTVSMVMLAGVLSAGAAFWHTDKLNNSYHEAAEKELEERALAYAVTTGVFLDVLGPQAPGVLAGLVSEFISSSER